MSKALRLVLVGAALAASGHAFAFELGVVGFQFSSETHARAANAAAARAKAKGWTVTLLNSEGALPKHAEQFDALIARKVDAIVIAMGKPAEADAQFKAAKDAGIPVVTIASGVSPHALFDVQANEYKIGAMSALALLGQMGYRGQLLSARFEMNVATRIRGKIMDAALSENPAMKEVGKFSMGRTQSWREDVRGGMQALILQNQGKIDGVWASFDAQGYIIDDLLKAQGAKKGEIPLVSADGGPETYRRIADPESLFTATVAVPFEEMGRKAVDAIDEIVVQKKSKTTVTAGPYLYVDGVLVDKDNVAQFLK